MVETCYVCGKQIINRDGYVVDGKRVCSKTCANAYVFIQRYRDMIFKREIYRYYIEYNKDKEVYLDDIFRPDYIFNFGDLINSVGVLSLFRGVGGVYAFYRTDDDGSLKIVYIGQTKDLSKRLYKHNKGMIGYVGIQIILDDNIRREREKRLIRMYKPEDNIVRNIKKTFI